MIDSTGKRITNDEQALDLNFALAEIKFFIKGFRNENNDEKALEIAKCIYTFLKEGGNPCDVIDFTLELENYSVHTQSDTFVWYLVYIRRLQSKYFLKTGNKKLAAEHTYIGAKHFEKICELNPSEHNLCCRIYEYVAATIDFASADIFHKNQEILAYAEDLFIKLEDNVSEEYIKAGIYVYFNLYIDYVSVQNDNDRAFESIKRTVKYAWRLYALKKDVRSLDTLCRYYSFYLDCEQISFEIEEEKIRNLLDHISKVPNKTISLKIRESALLTALKKFEETKKTQNN